MHGPLSVGLGVVFGASIGQLFFPSAMLANIALYGGAAVFGSFVLYDTTKIRYNAQVFFSFSFSFFSSFSLTHPHSLKKKINKQNNRPLPVMTPSTTPSTSTLPP